MHQVTGDPDGIDYGVVTPLPEDVLLERFGTTQPTREMIEQDLDILEEVDRGQGIYVIVYRDGRPAEIFFGGLSYD